MVMGMDQEAVDQLLDAAEEQILETSMPEEEEQVIMDEDTEE